MTSPSSAPVAFSPLPLPETVDQRPRWRYVVGIVGMHVLALLACWPYLWSWWGAMAFVLGIYLFGTLGINIGYHRLLTHRGFSCSPRLEHALALLGICCLEDTPAHWVAIHRMHHQHSDDQPDPHSPLVSFFWGHMGWLFVENHALNRWSLFEHYAKDLLRDPFYRNFERGNLWLWVNLAQWVVYFFLGAVVGWMTSGTLSECGRMGASLVVWGVFLRTVAVWHITWSVNSATHLWGYRNYETSDRSRNNVLVGLLSNGEGWHNNHHAQPRAVSHGHYWWEFDVAFLSVRLFQGLGLARDLVLPQVAPRGSKGKPGGATEDREPNLPNSEVAADEAKTATF